MKENLSRSKSKRNLSVKNLETLTDSREPLNLERNSKRLTRSFCKCKLKWLSKKKKRN